MLDTPNTPSWHWFGSCPEDLLKKIGGDQWQAPWLQNAYAWYWNRQPQSVRNRLEDPTHESVKTPPPNYFMPFPVSIESGAKRTGRDAGAVAFVSVDSSGSPDAGIPPEFNGTVYETAHKAAKVVYDIFRRFDRSIGWPEVYVEAPAASGDSLSLSAMIAALCRILKIAIPDTIIASGGLDTEAWSPVLKTVSPATLCEKLTAAARFGYSAFFLVEGQEALCRNRPSSPLELFETLKTEGAIPADSAMKIIQVSSCPAIALFQILRSLPHSDEAVLAEFMGAFQRTFNWYSPSLEEMLISMSESQSPLIRHTALEMLCRMELHKGNSLKAAEYQKKVPTLSPTDYPIGPLASYLKYEEPSSRSILKLDLGIWDDEDPDHALVARILDRQCGFIQDSIADIEDIRTALAAANTQARRLFFTGRLKRDENILKKAWERLLFFRDYWSAIFEYTQKMEWKDENLQRQINQCLECAEDIWSLTNDAPEIPFEESELTPLEEAAGYDLVGFLRFQMLTRPKEEIDMEKILERADRLYETYKGYPNYIPYEKAIIYGLGSDEQLRHCRKKLAEADHLKKKHDGIMAILAMRTHYVLEDWEKTTDAVTELAKESPLARLAEELLAAPVEIAFRAPY